MGRQGHRSLDYHQLSRRKLQSLSKKYGLPANKTNTVMADSLRALLKDSEHTPKEIARTEAGVCSTEPCESSLLSHTEDPVLQEVLPSTEFVTGIYSEIQETERYESCVEEESVPSGATRKKLRTETGSLHVDECEPDNCASDQSEIEVFESTLEQEQKVLRLPSPECLQVCDSAHLLLQLPATADSDGKFSKETAGSTFATISPASILKDPSMQLHVSSDAGVNLVVDLEEIGIQHSLHRFFVPLEKINIQSFTHNLRAKKQQEESIPIPALIPLDSALNLAARSAITEHATSIKHHPVLTSPLPKHEKRVKFSSLISVAQGHEWRQSESSLQLVEADYYEPETASDLQMSTGAVEDLSSTSILAAVIAKPVAERSPGEVMQQEALQCSGSQSSVDEVGGMTGFVREMVKRHEQEIQQRETPVRRRREAYKKSPFVKTRRSDGEMASMFKVGCAKRAEILASKRTMPLRLAESGVLHGNASGDEHADSHVKDDGNAQMGHEELSIAGVHATATLRHGGIQQKNQVRHFASSRRHLLGKALPKKGLKASKRKAARKAVISKAVEAEKQHRCEEFGTPALHTRSPETENVVSIELFRRESNVDKENVCGKLNESVKKHKDLYKTPLTGKSREKSRKVAKRIAANMRSKILRQSRGMETRGMETALTTAATTTTIDCPDTRTIRCPLSPLLKNIMPSSSRYA